MRNPKLELEYQMKKKESVKTKKGVSLIVATSPIPSHPKTDIVDTALKSILKMNYPFAEVIISYDIPPNGVEKASYKKYKAAMKKKYPNFTHLEMTKHGHFIGAFHNALRHSRTEHFLMLQHDMKLDGKFPIDACLKYKFDWNIIATHHMKNGLQSQHWFPIFKQKNKDLWKSWGWSERIFLSKRDWMMDQIYKCHVVEKRTSDFMDPIFQKEFKREWKRQTGLSLSHASLEAHTITTDEMKAYNKLWNEWKCFLLKSNVAYHVHLCGRTALAKKKTKRTKKRTKRKTSRGGCSKGGGKKLSKETFKKMISEMEQSVQADHKKCNTSCDKIKTNYAKDKKKLQLKQKCNQDCWKKRTKTVKAFHKKYPKEFEIFVKNLGGGGGKTIKKCRKGPDESATKYAVGTEKLGNDGNTWVINVSKKGVQRWVKQVDKASESKTGSKSESKKTLRKELDCKKFTRYHKGKGNRLQWPPVMMGIPAGKGQVYKYLEKYNQFTDEPVPVKKGLVAKRVKNPDDDAWGQYCGDRKPASKADMPVHPGSQKYFIHDNGGRPFLVYVAGNNVWIYKHSKETVVEDEKDLDNPKYYTELVKEYTAKQVFIGKSPKNEMTKYSGGHGPKFTGNSILLKIGDKRYVSIGWTIYEFSTKDEIIEYHSPVGNSDVPYPVAIGTDYVYFMIEDVYVAKELFEDFPKKYKWHDHAYAKLWGQEPFTSQNKSDMKKHRKQMMHIKMVHKRTQ